jgi:hypothetical protein
VLEEMEKSTNAVDVEKATVAWIEIQETSVHFDYPTKIIY